MIKPTIDELLTKTDSKYTLACVAAKRAREIVNGSEPRNNGDAAKPVTMALQELGQGELQYEQSLEGLK